MIKRVLQFVWLAIVALYFLPSLAYAQTTWYVRSDGGTATQCDGKHWAAYPGSGTNQPCAYNHPMWLVSGLSGGNTTQRGSWVIAGGDVVLIRNTDTYIIGLDDASGAETTLCNGDALDCHFPTPPAGTANSNTTICGTSDGLSCCTSGPQVLLKSSDGSNRTEEIFQIDQVDPANNPAQYYKFGCMELQGWNHAANAATSSTGGNGLGTFGFKNREGFNASTIGSNLTLSYVKVHGFASSGEYGGYNNQTFTNVDFARNGHAGIEMDIGDGVKHNYGTWNLTNQILEWNGCLETSALVQVYCLDDNNSGFGSGFSSPGGGVGQDSSINLTLTNPIVRFNSKDGVDGLHCFGCTLTITGGLFQSNAGDQLKFSATTGLVRNNIFVGNCSCWASFGACYQYEKNGGLSNFDFCRAAGDVAVLNGSNGASSMVFQFNSLTGQGNYAIDEGCRDTCSSQTYDIEDNIFYGDYQQGQVGHGLLDTIYNVTGTQIEGHNDWYNMRNSGPGGSGDITSNPNLVNPSDSSSFDPHLQSGSPAIDTGVMISGVTTDFAGNTRETSKADMGAYEFGGSGAPPPTKPNPPSNLKVVVQ